MAAEIVEYRLTRYLTGRETASEGAWTLKVSHADGRPVIDSTGIHELRISFDGTHRTAVIEVFDAKGGAPRSLSLVYQGVSWPSNAARLEVVRDNGFVIENVFLDRTGRVIEKLDCRNRDVTCSR